MEGKNVYSNLDGLRAYAAVSIVIMHVYANMNFRYQGLTNSLINSFAELTLLFFIISAFSLCCGYYDKFKTGQIDIPNFYSRRFSRILPFFALMTLIDLVVSPSWNSLWEGISNISMVFGLLPNPDIDVIGVGWFVGVIFVFYLLFPFFLYLIDTRTRALLAICGSILVYMITCNYWMTEDYILSPIGKHNFLYSSPFFMVGGVIFIFRNEISKYVQKHMLLSYISIIVFSGLYFIVPRVVEIGSFKLGFIDTTYEFADKSILNFSILYMLPIQASWICLSIGPQVSFLKNRFTSFISSISMEIYLSHMMAFRIVEKINIPGFVINDETSFWICAISTLLISVIFSYVIKYKLFPIASKCIIGK